MQDALEAVTLEELDELEVYIAMNTFIYMYIHICVYTYVYTYMYMYVNINIVIHIYIYIYRTGRIRGINRYKLYDYV
jgi:hypothetical protein